MSAQNRISLLSNKVSILTIRPFSYTVYLALGDMDRLAEIRICAYLILKLTNYLSAASFKFLS